MDKDTADTIARWKTEYERVNAKKAPDVFYRRGWFTIQLSKYRRADVLGMIERLSRRPDGEGAS